MTEPRTNEEVSNIAEVYPAQSDIVLMNLEPHSVARIHHPDGPREYRARGSNLIMSVVADPRTLERFGQSETYHALFAVHRGINALHSAAWTDATRLIQKGGIALIHHERLDEFGLPDWASLWASKVTGDNPRFETAMVLARRMLEGRPRDPRPQLSPLLLERALFRAHVALVEDWTL